MKTFFTNFLFFLSLASLNNLHAQTDSLKNGGFENWVDINGWYEEPAGWYTLNYLYKFGYDPTTTKTTDKHSGTSALLLESKSGTNSDLVGILCSGFMFDTITNGNPDFSKNLIPFHSRPVSLQFYYKSFPSSGDTAACFFLLSKWNSVAGHRDTVAAARWFSGSTVNTYTQAIVPFIYSSAATPDSASIIFLSSLDGFNPTPGSQLFIDDLALSYSAGVGDMEANSHVFVYPNPVSDVLSIEGMNDRYQVSISGINGKEFYTGTHDGVNNSLQLNFLSPGIYFMHLSGTATGTKMNFKIIKN